MDGVLVDINSSWGYVHEKLGVDASENFQNYLNYKIDYKEFMRRDIRLWGYRHIDEITSILNDVPVMTGLKETLQQLKQSNYQLTILTAGISLLAERLDQEFDFHNVFANKLCTDETGLLTGEGEGVVELLSKAKFLDTFLEKRGIPKKECIVVGDSHFDVPMFKNAGLSIAFNTTDPSVKQAANQTIEKKDLRKLLALLK